MAKRTGLWVFSGPLRVAVILLTVLYCGLYLVHWGLALAGNTAPIYAIVDTSSEEPLSLIQLFTGMFIMGILVASLVLIAVTANRFLKTAYRDGFFGDQISRTLKNLGYGMILFWLGLVLTENYMPWLLTYHLEPQQRAELDWFPLDMNFIALLVGFVLLLLSNAMDEARSLEQDNKQFI